MLPSSNVETLSLTLRGAQSFEDKRCCVCVTLCASCQQGVQSPLGLLLPFSHAGAGQGGDLLLSSRLLPKPPSGERGWFNRRVTNSRSCWVPKFQAGPGQSWTWYTVDPAFEKIN